MTSAEIRPQRQGLRFLAVGALNTVWGIACFFVLQLTLGQVTSYMVVLCLAWGINVFEAYLAYRYLVFRVEGQFWGDLVRFSTVFAAAFAFNVVALPVGVRVLGLPVLVVQTMVWIITVIASFFSHREFSFRRPSQPAGAVQKAPIP